ncbi:hypothetical protein O9H85_31235 [Paenibacillus filicis]|uniref:Uncharacterized protein n=1 Tax=Paenibacillus gyeongsangnamensis TaxID=3388067 RepID=A0ABT4QJ87_9BACL|nr:hypothetical protein [Paenibacillus filicis]MCZ8516760.1 hypothetical protein [Paenibacillus filicis]
MKAVVAKRMARIIDDAATVADVETSDILSSLESGRNLISATGLSAKELTEQLVNMADQDIELVALQGSTEKAVAEGKQDARSQINQLINENGLTRKSNDQALNPQAVIDQRLAILADDVAFISGIDKDSVVDAVARKTLVQASGMTPSDLVERLADFASQDLDSFASGKNVPADKLLQWKADAKRQIFQKLNS